MDHVEAMLQVLDEEMKKTAPRGEATLDVSHCSGEEIIAIIEGAARLAKANSRHLKGVRLAAECFTRAGIRLVDSNSGDVGGVPVIKAADFDTMDLVFEAERA